MDEAFEHSVGKAAPDIDWHASMRGVTMVLRPAHFSPAELVSGDREIDWLHC
jgi:hypothetical protein